MTQNHLNRLSLHTAKCTVLGWGILLLSTLPLSMLAAAIVHFSLLNDSCLRFCAAVVQSASAWIGAFVAARLHREHGLLMGVFTALPAGLLLMLCGGKDPDPVLALCLILLCGMAGGLLGRKVND